MRVRGRPSASCFITRESTGLKPAHVVTFQGLDARWQACEGRAALTEREVEQLGGRQMAHGICHWEFIYT